MQETIFRDLVPHNEPVRQYAPGSEERASLQDKLAALAAERIAIPCVIDGQPVETGDLGRVVMPHEHGHVLADFHQAGQAEFDAALAAARRAKPDWEAASWDERAAVFLLVQDCIAQGRGHLWRDELDKLQFLRREGIRTGHGNRHSETTHREREHQVD